MAVYYIVLTDLFLWMFTVPLTALRQVWEEHQAALLFPFDLNRLLTVHVSLAVGVPPRDPLAVSWSG